MVLCQLARKPQLLSPEVNLLSFSWDFSAFAEAACSVARMCGASGPFPVWYLTCSSQIIPSAAASIGVLLLVLVDTSVFSGAGTAAHGEQVVSMSLRAGVGGRLAEDPSSPSLGQKKDFHGFVRVDPESSEGEMGRRARGEEGPAWPLQDKILVLVLVNREPGIREVVCPAGPRMLLGQPGRGVLTARPAPPSGVGGG